MGVNKCARFKENVGDSIASSTEAGWTGERTPLRLHHVHNAKRNPATARSGKLWMSPTFNSIQILRKPLNQIQAFWSQKISHTTERSVNLSLVSGLTGCLKAILRSFWMIECLRNGETYDCGSPPSSLAFSSTQLMPLLTSSNMSITVPCGKFLRMHGRNFQLLNRNLATPEKRTGLWLRPFRRRASCVSRVCSFGPSI